MDEIKSKIERPKDIKKQRKLVRSPEVTVCDIISASIEASTAESASYTTDVMGGGLITSPSILSSISSSTSRKNNTHTLIAESQPTINNSSVPFTNATTTTTITTTTNTVTATASIIYKRNLISSSTKTKKSCSENVDNKINLTGSSCLLHQNKSEKSDIMFKRFLSASFKNKRTDESNRNMGGDLSTKKGSNNIDKTNVSGSSKDNNIKIGNNDDSASFSRFQDTSTIPSSSFNTMNDTTKTSQIIRPQQQRSDPTSDYHVSGGASTIRLPSDEGYYFTMTSPNNPFLPEIIAKSYNDESSFLIDDNIEIPTPLSKTLSSPSSLTEKSYKESSLSLSSSQEQDQQTSVSSFKNNNMNSKNIFTLCSPTKDFSQKNEMPKQLSFKEKYIKQQNNTKGKCLNPFLSGAASFYSDIESTISNHPKNDLNAKREQFLKATMKICLVVSPPSSKLQLKSKSLTHLDTLDSMVQSPSVSQYQQQPDGSDQEEMTVQQQHLNFPKSLSNQEQIKSKPINNINAGSTAHIISTGQTTLSANPSNGTPFFIQKKKASFMHRKKPILSRSEISSSEYFSICFYTDAGYQEEELIPVIKGVTLFDALSNSLRKRNLSFSQITISDNNFQNITTDAEPPPSLDGNTDTENLAGKVLTIFEKGGYKKIGTLQKAASFGSRTRPPRLLSSASTEETTEIEQKQIPAKQLKQRWSGLFGIKNPQQNQLCELLNNYAKNGVPQKLSSVSFDHPDFEMAIKYLDKPHKSWREFIHCNNDMTDIDIKIQSAIWELVTTEIDYIHALKTVTDLFLACLEAIQQEKILIDLDQNKLFSNIHDICEANLKFWTYYLYPMVAHSIKTNQPMCIDYFQPGFVTFATTFSPYKKYCAEQSTCQFYCKELNRTNALFTAYLAWCESQKMCNRLRLADILVRPMQRLTKYSLLLTAIRKHISDENDYDIMDSMIHSVESFVYSVNTHLTTRQENERLKGIMARIESYDVVDSNNEQLDKLAKQYCTMLDLCAPMKGCLTNHGRHLFMEGDLKLKDNFGKSDVHCFLLTDILLICKTIAKKGQGTLKVIRQPYLTDKLIVKHKDNTLYCIYLNEFQMVIQAFTLQCAEAKCWYDSITKAKHIYSRLKQGSNWDSYNIRYGNNTTNIINNPTDTLGVKRSPLNSSIGSRVSSLNNSHSGSVELNDSRNISIDFEKTNSLSSDEGSNPQQKTKTLISPHNLKTTFTNTLTVQPHNHLGQSLPNLNLHPGQASNLYHTYSNNTLLVPGKTHSGNVLLSPSHRGISYPPPSPTRATLRRGFAFSSSIKNPPLLKTRNITSQSSINWQQNPASTSSQSIGSVVFQQQQQQQEQRQKQQQQQQPSPTSSQQPLITEQTPVGLKINETDV